MGKLPSGFHVAIHDGPGAVYLRVYVHSCGAHNPIA